jgi:adenine deaminase
MSRNASKTRGQADPLAEGRKGARHLAGRIFPAAWILPLPVIPHLKISDRGLVGIDRFCLIDAAGA